MGAPPKTVNSYFLLLNGLRQRLFYGKLAVNSAEWYDLKTYQIRTSLEEGRPEIQYDHPACKRIDWLHVGKVLSGTLPVDADSLNLQVGTQDCADTSGWDFFSVPGVGGAFSARFIEVVGEANFVDLQLLPILINTEEFFLLRRDERDDWFGVDRACFDAVPGPDVLSLVKEMLPSLAIPNDCLFFAPRIPKILVTEQIAKRLDAMSGLRLIPVFEEEKEDKPQVDSVSSHYENAPLGVQVTFPSPWKLSSWQNVKRIDGKCFQTHNEDLPESDGRMKYLFVARIHDRYSPAMLDADIELSVMRHPEGFNLAASMAENFEKTKGMYQRNGIDTQRVGSGDWEVSGVTFAYVDKVNTSGTETRGSAKKKSQYRFVFRKISPTLWLYAKIAGHKESAYQHALEVFGSLQCSDGA